MDRCRLLDGPMRVMVRFLLLLAALAPANAERLIETSALMTCQENSQLQAKQFSVQFFPSNNSAMIQAQVISNIDGNFSATIELIAYGITVMTKKITNCEIADTLCPMSPGHFDVDTTFDKLGSVVKQVPGIAYTMPNLDGVVRVNVYPLVNGNVESNSIACVEAVLSNGQTVQTKYVSWALFGVISLGLLIAGVMTLLGQMSTASHITSNVVSLFAYFQGVAVICMMAVNRLPPIAAAWGQNFMWTMGIIQTEFMQKIMTWYVRATGGDPTNILPNENIISIAVYRQKWKRELGLEAAMRLVKRVPGAATSLVKRLSTDSDYTTTNERDSSLINKTLVLQGIRRVAFLAKIELSNFFLTGATFFIFVGLFLVAILAIVKGILELLAHSHGSYQERFIGYRKQWSAYTKGILFRYFLVGFTQLSVLCLWEFADRVSVATVVDAAIMYAVVITSLAWASVKVIILARESTKLFQNPAYILYGNNEILHRWGFLYVQFRASAYYFLVPLLAYNFIKSAVIALGQANGKVQSIILLVVEFIFLVVVSWLKPYMDKKTNAFNISIAAISFINSIFFLFFSQLFGPKADVASSIVGVVFFILNAIFSLVLLILIIVACVWAIVHKNPDSRYQPMRDDREAFTADTDKVGHNELSDMAYVVRDGYRESFLHHDDSSSTKLHSNNSDETLPQAMRYKSHGSSDDLDQDYPSYRQHQSGAVSAAGGAYARPQSYYDSTQRLTSQHH